MLVVKEVRHMHRSFFLINCVCLKDHVWTFHPSRSLIHHDIMGTIYDHGWLNYRWLKREFEIQRILYVFCWLTCGFIANFYWSICFVHYDWFCGILHSICQMLVDNNIKIIRHKIILSTSIWSHIVTMYNFFSLW